MSKPKTSHAGKSGATSNAPRVGRPKSKNPGVPAGGFRVPRDVMDRYAVESNRTGISINKLMRDRVVSGAPNVKAEFL